MSLLLLIVVLQCSMMMYCLQAASLTPLSVPKLQTLASRTVAHQIAQALLQDGYRCDLSKSHSISQLINNTIDERIIDSADVLHAMKLQLGMPEYIVPIGPENKWQRINKRDPAFFTIDRATQTLFTFCGALIRRFHRDVSDQSYREGNFIHQPMLVGWEKLLFNSVTQEIFQAGPCHIFIMPTQGGDNRPTQGLYPDNHKEHFCFTAQRTAPPTLNEKSQTLFVPVQPYDIYTAKALFPEKMYVWKRDNQGVYQRIDTLASPHGYFTSMVINEGNDEVFIITGHNKVHWWRNIKGVYSFQPPMLDNSTARAIAHDQNKRLFVLNQKRKEFVNITAFECDGDGCYHKKKTFQIKQRLADKGDIAMFFNPTSNMLLVSIADAQILFVDTLTGIYYKGPRGPNGVNLGQSTTELLSNNALAQFTFNGLQSPDGTIKIYSPYLRQSLLALPPSVEWDESKLTLEHLLVLNAIQMQASYKQNIIIHPFYHAIFHAIKEKLTTDARNRCYLPRQPIVDQDPCIRESDTLPALHYSAVEVLCEASCNNFLNADLTTLYLKQQLERYLKHQLENPTETHYDWMEDYFRSLIYPPSYTITLDLRRHILFYPAPTDIHGPSFFWRLMDYYCVFNAYTQTMFALWDNRIAACRLGNDGSLSVENANNCIYKASGEEEIYSLHSSNYYNLLVLLSYSSVSARHCLTVLHQNPSGVWKVLSRTSLNGELLADSFNNHTNDLILAHRCGKKAIEVVVQAYDHQEGCYRRIQSLPINGAKKIAMHTNGEELFIATQDSYSFPNTINVLYVYRRDAATGCYVLTQAHPLYHDGPGLVKENNVVSLSYNQRLNVLAIRRENTVELWERNRHGTYQSTLAQNITRENPQGCLLLDVASNRLFYEERPQAIATDNWYEYHRVRMRISSRLDRRWASDIPPAWCTDATREQSKKLSHCTLLQKVLLANIIKRSSDDNSDHHQPIAINAAYSWDVNAIADHLAESIRQRITFVKGPS